MDQKNWIFYLFLFFRWNVNIFPELNHCLDLSLIKIKNPIIFDIQFPSK